MAYANRMFMLDYGRELVHKSLSVLGGSDAVLAEPIPGVAVETDDGVVILDTGISRQALDDIDTVGAMYGDDLLPTGPTGDPLHAALAAVGYGLDDVCLAVVSHFHLDHSGGIRTLSEAGIPVVIDAAELEYVQARIADGTEQEVACYRDDFTDVATKWQTVGGDEQIAAGVSVFATPGHTPGHLSFRVDLRESGTWLFAADAADLGENLLERIPCGAVAEPSDAGRAAASVNRLMEEGSRLDARVVPGHDPVFWRALRHPSGGHR
ncbi:N-acyl homoserine lactonase family protein [Gordonia jinhuaensis]|uniref:MBL fold metallo-hydrolase n=1 Tax=Gordonia jinhuaensis TaxID=1517702 RepID=A0A916T1Q9_9ACTN|nr:N-acyl homoserine lactonase family protein [Gordonia jinhuaensis]GGB28442.1 MBL fold metallo-hydrolase [Gordonia jinhuaensis]